MRKKHSKTMIMLDFISNEHCSNVPSFFAVLQLLNHHSYLAVILLL